MNELCLKRVLVVVAHPLGGIRSYLHYNLRHLAKSGYLFTFIAPEGHAFEAFKNDVRHWSGVEFVDVPIHNRHFSLRRSVRRALLTRRFTLIHSQGLRAGTETALANIGLRIPHVLTLHDTRQRSDFPGRFALPKKWLVQRLSIRANIVIAVSDDCLKNHLTFFPRWRRFRHRLAVIRNGVEVEELCRSARSISRNGLRDLFGWDKRVTVAGYFGRFMPEKGFPVLLDSLRLLSKRGRENYFRLIATRDPHGYGREYSSMVERDPALNSMVRFIEPVTEIGSVLPQVDFLVMPSLWEACPLLPMEAMVLGVPVVGSDAIGLREILRDTPSLTPPAGDCHALATAIEQMSTSSARQKGLSFMPVARERFSNTMAVNELGRVYERLGLRGLPSKTSEDAR